MSRIYFDSGVLIAAFQNDPRSSAPIWGFLRDREHVWLASLFTRLETVPQAAYNKRLREVQFLEWVLASAEMLDHADRMLTDHAADLGMKYGLHGMDALHVASALRLRAEKFLTTEKSTKPLFRVAELQVVHVPSK